MAPGIDLHLSNGDEGEILSRSAIMFSKYVYIVHVVPQRACKTNDDQISL